MKRNVSPHSFIKEFSNSKESEPAWNSDPEIEVKLEDSSEPETRDYHYWTETRDCRSVLPTDVQQLSVSKEEPPEKWCPSLDHEDTEPLHVKEEQEELWISQDGEQLQGQEEADIIKFTFSPGHLKTEDDDDESSPCSQLHQIETEQIERAGDGEDCEGSEQSWSSDPDNCSAYETEVKIEETSEPEPEGCNNVKDTSVSHSGLSSVERAENNEPNTKKKLHSCPACGKMYIFKAHLERHLRIHLEGNSITCPVCGLKFNYTSHLKVHLRTHTGEKPFSCPQCGKRFRRKRHLTYHLRIHTGEKPFSCSECDRQFNCKEYLTNHMRVHTGEKPFPCSECGKRFNSQEYLTTHMRIHRQEKPFSCSECGKDFCSKESVNQHMQAHSTKKPFCCSVCGKAYKRKTTLTQHMFGHKTEKRFNCSECGKGFNCKRILAKHMFVHTGEKPLSCSECGKRFAIKGYLKKHMMNHTGERPFCCSECNKSFKDKAQLNRHMINHTGEKPLSCSCGQKFSWHSQLKRHKLVCVHVSEPLKKQTEPERQPEAGADVEDCGGSEGTRNSGPDKELQPEIEVTIEDFCDES